LGCCVGRSTLRSTLQSPRSHDFQPFVNPHQRLLPSSGLTATEDANQQRQVDQQQSHLQLTHRRASRPSLASRAAR
jgi:hypothetical protein